MTSSISPRRERQLRWAPSVTGSIRRSAPSNWLRQLQASGVASRAVLARREGLSRAWVSQVFHQVDGAVARRQRAG
jgi:hypothetical protein